MALRFARPARPTRWAALSLVVLLALGATVAALGGAEPDDGGGPVTDAGDLLTNEAKRDALPFAESDSARAASGGGAAASPPGPPPKPLGRAASRPPRRSVPPAWVGRPCPGWWRPATLGW